MQYILGLCRPAFAFLLDQAIPIVNFAVLLVVLVKLQVVRAELDGRLARFTRIDEELAALKRDHQPPRAERDP